MRKLLLHTALILISTVSIAQKNPTAAAFSVSYGYEYNKDYVKAIATITKIYKADSYEMNIRLGWLTYMNADYMKSKSYYQKAMNISPRSIEARLGIANPLSALRSWEEIIRVYKDILTISENHFLTNYRLAYIYYDKKKFDVANRYATKVQSLQPFNYDNNLLLGKINISLGNITIAKKYLNSALLYSPSSVEVIGLLKVL